MLVLEGTLTYTGLRAHLGWEAPPLLSRAAPTPTGASLCSALNKHVHRELAISFHIF